MTKVNFTDWLHTELNAVFHGDITPEQVMLNAIPMIDAMFSQNNGKPIVSGALPVWAAELLTEVRFRLLFDMDNEGELRSSMAELLGMWDKVNKALNIKTVGQ